MRNVLHRVYGDGVCLNCIDSGSCWSLMDGWQETDFKFYMANTLCDSLLFRLGVWTHSPMLCHMYTAVHKCAHIHIRTIKLSGSACVCVYDVVQWHLIHNSDRLSLN